MSLPLSQLLLGLIVVPLALSIATCGSQSTQADVAVVDESDSPTRGRELYARYCALCHGPEGQGYAADNANALANPELLATATDSFLRVAIVRGRVGTPMSAFGHRFGGPLSGPDVENLIEFIRGWQTAPSVPLPSTRIRGDAARGRELYAEHCAQCHGPEGQGKSAPTLDTPTFHATVSDAFIRYAIEHGRSGTPMPGFASQLSPEQLDDLTVFVRSLRRNAQRQVARKLPDVPLVIHPKGPQPDFALRDDLYVPAAQVKAALDAGARMVIADARPQSDYLEFRITGAISLPFYAVDEFAEKLPKDGTWILAYCACPHAASGRVARALRDRGFQNTAVIDEGVLVWRQRGYPITEGE